MLRYLFGILVLASLSGCRFGNHTEEAPPPPTDPYVGYYATHPNELRASVVTEKGPVEQAGTLEAIPNLISNFVSNPMVFGHFTTGEYGINTYGVKGGVPVDFDSNSMTFKFSFSSKPSTFWTDPACKTWMTLQATGFLKKYSQPTSSSVPITGQMGLTFQVTYQFKGKCTPSFQALATCYDDPSRCGAGKLTENQVDALDVMKTLIESQIITISDIPSLSSYAYEVSYQ